MTSDPADDIPASKDEREGYRDELNFAEFPLALLDRPAKDQKTLEFSDIIFDYGNNVTVKRKLTISASDKFGLPTTLDEEVILGLIQLSHQSNFADRKVHFTKGELIRLLGWPDDGKSYKRLSEALNKWAGITLFWENSWWSKEENCWVDETFHILDNVTLYDKERYNRRVKMGGRDTTAGMSSFVWNETVYASFKSGYIKQIDLDFYKSLRSAISKKMFRFLDKRFYKKKHLEFDLQVFAFEHIGLSRNYHNGEIKRKLKVAIQELEERGFLEPLEDARRFTKKERGVWSVTFIKKGHQEAGKETERSESDEAIRQLSLRGVTPKIAEELASTYPEDKILEKIRLLDAMREKKDKRVSRNPAGFLVSAIKQDFNPPKDLDKAPLTLPTDRERSKGQPLNSAERKTEKETVKLNKEFDKWWSKLSAEEQQQFEEEAVNNANRFQYEQYTAGKETQGLLFKTVQKSILIHHFLRRGLSKVDKAGA